MIVEGEQQSDTKRLYFSPGDSTNILSGSTRKILASKRYTRSNPDPDLSFPVDNPESIIKSQRHKGQSVSVSIQRSKSLNTASDRVSRSAGSDISPFPLHKAKSGLNLRECFEAESSLWFSPSKRIKRKLVYSESTLSKSPKVSGEGQPVSYPIIPVKGG